MGTALAPIGSVQETFAAAYAAWAKEQPPTSVHRALMRASQSPQRHWFGPEVSNSACHMIAWYFYDNNFHSPFVIFYLGPFSAYNLVSL